MGTSLRDLQRQVLLGTLKNVGNSDWKVLVLDDHSRRLLFNVASEDDILGANITSIETLATRRQSQPDTDAVYLVSPLPHVLQTLERDLNDRRYRRAFLLWTSRLSDRMRDVLYRSESRRAQIADNRTLNIDFFPQESQLVTFREPSSFSILFNKECRQLIPSHLDGVVHKIFSVCVLLGEYPIIRYYSPRSDHYAAELCKQIARQVREMLDLHAQNSGSQFPPAASRSRSVLIITDRTMDLMAPLMHELTYQAMVMDLLPVREINDKLTYRIVTGDERADREERDVELREADQSWSSYRHKHMEHVLGKLGSDLKAFIEENQGFANQETKISVGDLQNMLADLPGFQQDKARFALHIDMASTCADIFQSRLLELISVEQILATQHDEYEAKARNVVDQVVKVIDAEGPFDPDWKGTRTALKPEERLRLLIMYVLYQGGTRTDDAELLLLHAGLSNGNSLPILKMFEKMEELGVKTQRQRPEVPKVLVPVFPYKKSEKKNKEDDANQTIDRFEPGLAELLRQEHEATLDRATFPFLDQKDAESAAATAAVQTSLRSAGHPTWHKGRGGGSKPKQRVIVFMAGGATYSEARECYTLPDKENEKIRKENEERRKKGQSEKGQWHKEVILVTSHMLTPSLFVQHLHELTRGPRDLSLPKDPEVPAWVTERPVQGLPDGPNGRGPRPPVNAMQNMNLGGRPADSRPPARGPSPARTPMAPTQPTLAQPDEGKHKKEKKEKKHGFSSMFKKH